MRVLLSVLLLVAPVALAQGPSPAPHRLEAPAAALAGRTASQVALLEKLNRADRAHLPRLGVIVVPEVWNDGPLAHSPLPLVWPAAFRHAKALAVDVAGQAFGAYEHGVLVRWGPVSSGRQSDPTPPGFYHLNWHSKGRHSTVDAGWFMPWYFNFHNRKGLAFHQFVLPGRPASHACVRLLERDARWLWDWGEGWTLAADGRTLLSHGTRWRSWVCTPSARRRPGARRRGWRRR